MGNEPPGDRLRLWQAAEARLALLAVADPEAYVRHLEIVGRVSDRLLRRDTSAATEVPDSRIEAVVAPMVREEVGGDAQQVDVGAIAGAACLVYHRQHTAARNRGQMAARIDSARRRGVRWVTVWEQTPSPPSTLSFPYERIVMRLADGVAVRATIDVDPETYGPSYIAEVVQLDPGTGLPVSCLPLERPQTFPDRAAWERGVEGLLAELNSAEHGETVNSTDPLTRQQGPEY